MKAILALLLALTFASPVVMAISDAPAVVNYQGKLLNSSGTQVTDGTYTITFKLYNGSSTTSVLWGSSYSVVVSGGFFNVVLGDPGSAVSGATYTSIATALGNTSSPYLGLTVLTDNSGNNINNPQEITPRLRFLSSPYAINAQYSRNADNAGYATNAATLGGLQPNQFLQPASSAPSTLGAALTTPGLTVNGSSTHNGATTLNGNVTITGTLSASNPTTGGGFIPVGGIIMWSGSSSSVPSGWALCNGTSVNGVAVPDLRDRFVVGGGMGGSYNAGATGGNSSITLGLNQIPPHRHIHRDGIFGEANIGSSGQSPDGLGSGYDSGNKYIGSHNGWDWDNNITWMERYTYNAGGNAAGGTDSFDNRPPYYAMAFIIRVQ